MDVIRIVWIALPAIRPSQILQLRMTGIVCIYSIGGVFAYFDQSQRVNIIASIFWGRKYYFIWVFWLNFCCKNYVSGVNLQQGYLFDHLSPLIFGGVKIVDSTVTFSSQISLKLLVNENFNVFWLDILLKW